MQALSFTIQLWEETDNVVKAWVGRWSYDDFAENSSQINQR